MLEKWTSTLVITVITTVTVIGCSYNNVLEVEPDHSFDGLEEFFTYDAGSPDTVHLNVVFVHGMGHHPFGEIGLRKYQKKIAEQLGVSIEHVNSVDWGSLCPKQEKESDLQLQLKRESSDGLVTEKELLLELRQEGQAVCPLRINDVIVGYVGWRQYQETNNNETRVLNLFELSWDRATEILQRAVLELDENYEETIEFDENLEQQEGGRNREADRVWGNRWLKKFVNQRLGDPAVYMGAYGDSIRSTVADGLLKVASVEGTSKDNPYTIISDSMGSRIVFDTLDCVLGSSSSQDCKFLLSRPTYSRLETNQLRAFVANTAQVFMNANQLPFLALGEATAPKQGETEKEWLKRLPCEISGSGIHQFGAALVKSRGQDPKRENIESRPVKIIAFTDPNDALSYHLTQRFRDKCSSLSGYDESVIKFINVRITNAKWNYLFVLANPNKAHSSGFRVNSAAIDLVVHGYDSTAE